MRWYGEPRSKPAPAVPMPTIVLGARPRFFQVPPCSPVEEWWRSPGGISNGHGAPQRRTSTVCGLAGSIEVTPNSELPPRYMNRPPSPR